MLYSERFKLTIAELLDRPTFRIHLLDAASRRTAEVGDIQELFSAIGPVSMKSVQTLVSSSSTYTTAGAGATGAIAGARARGAVAIRRH